MRIVLETYEPYRGGTKNLSIISAQIPAGPLNQIPVDHQENSWQKPEKPCEFTAFSDSGTPIFLPNSGGRKQKPS